MENPFSRAVKDAFAYLIDQYDFKHSSEEEYVHVFEGRHVKVEIYYGKWELDVLLTRTIYTSILRPQKQGSFRVGWLLHYIDPAELNELREIRTNTDRAPTDQELELMLSVYARKLKEHFYMVLKGDLKYLEELAVHFHKSE